MSEKIILTAKASLFEPSETDIEHATQVLQTVANKRGKAFKLPDRHDDLLYLRKTLVTAGINANDDVFLIDELWKARHTPVLKPLNWMHNDKDIIGVMYTSQAFTLGGDPLPDDLESVNEPFELIVDGVVYQYTFPDKAEEIRRRHAEGNLYCSMEAWFDNYDFALFKQKDFDTLIKRETATAFLDSQLKVRGGTGFYEDAGVKKRLGRALRNIIFGGSGIVNYPANQRSKVFQVGEIPDGNKENDSSEYLFDDITSGQSELFYFVDNVPFLANAKEVREDDMADTQSDNVKHLTKGDLRSVIADVLSEREEVATQEAEVAALRSSAENASAEKDKLAKANDQLKGELETLRSDCDNLTKAFDMLFSEIVDENDQGTEASLQSVHKAKTADEAMRMKLALFQEKAQSLRERAAAADEYRQKLEEAQVVARANEVADLLGDFVPEDKLEALQTRACNMTEDAYQNWITDQQIILAALKPEMMQKNKKNKNKPTPDSQRAEEGKAAEKFQQSGPLGLQNGTLPSAGGPLANPRFKISGEEELENAEVQNTVDLAGASTGEVEGEVDPIAAEASLLAKTFAAELHPHLNKRNKAEAAKVNFDPVKEV